MNETRRCWTTNSQSKRPGLVATHCGAPKPSRYEAMTDELMADFKQEPDIADVQRRETVFQRRVGYWLAEPKSQISAGQFA